jgi:hypothetical protein
VSDEWKQLVEKLNVAFGMEKAGMREYINGIYRWFDATFDMLLEAHDIDEDECLAWIQHMLVTGITDEHGDTHDVSSMMPWFEVWVSKRFDDGEEV